MQQRRASAATWATSDYVLAAGEIGVTLDTGIIKVGDGVNGWNALDPAFDSHYLPILGKAADSNALDGIDSTGFLQVGDATTAATADKVVKRLSDGRAKVAAGTATDDAVNLSQLTSKSISRTVTSAFTLALTDIGKMIVANSSAYATAIVCTIPTNASVAIPVGSVTQILANDKGPVTLTPAGGVTVNGIVPIYGGGSSAKLVKTATDTWQVMSVCWSPPPLLHRNIKAGSDNTMASGFFVPLRLDSADTPSHPYSDNVDTLGAGEQWSSANNTRVYCRRSGWYDIRAQASYGGSGIHRFFLEPTFNGNTGGDYLGSGIPRVGEADVSPLFACHVRVNVGDYLEVSGYQDSGSSQQIQQQSYVNSFVEWVWRRPL
jgi:hypothetical protein